MKRNWSGILTGVLTGLAIGYLTAPESGKKNRKKLGDALEERTGGFMQEIKDQWNKTVALAEEVLTNVKDEAGIFAHKAQDTVDTSKKK
ncbi:YtxH domain-containing protein [Spirosoma endophyticum]|uniref:YtxH-like protein n=1 Tax=Spirosoma endophyticum TaxID=662367 RepID=A0A1I2EAS0_9BACT|nr:YtxH domain-containing protein [Spirosoma endophyticum]SFE89773.1 YtxH-like protein [Spirosoma endophyticum]